MLVVACLTCLFTSCLSELMTTCFLSYIGLFVRIHSCFCRSWHNDVYNYLNTCMYAL
jgi:hypothetical protein